MKSAVHVPHEVRLVDHDLARPQRCRLGVGTPEQFLSRPAVEQGDGRAHAQSSSPARRRNSAVVFVCGNGCSSGTGRSSAAQIGCHPSPGLGAVERSGRHGCPHLRERIVGVAIARPQDRPRRTPEPGVGVAAGREEDDGVGERGCDLLPERRHRPIDRGRVSVEELVPSGGSPSAARRHASTCPGCSATSTMW